MVNIFKKCVFFAQALLNPAVPSRLKYEMGGCLLYFISPIDFVPDFLPLTGRADDVVVLLWGIKRGYDVIKAHRKFLSKK
ncbi:MAG: YkvA family protein [Elusimicrobiota bacterium]